MKKFQLNLHLFDSTYSVTCYKDAHASAFSASPNSSVATDADVALTVTPATGYEVDEIEVIAGGVTITEEGGSYGFKMGTANVVLNLKTKKSTLYMVTEECMASVNGTKVVFHKNVKYEITPNGVIKGVNIESGGADVTVTAAVQELINQGILVKI
ncbi:MAG: hypothetical protein K6F61_05065 [Clostridiales bacterium]|nr:hypothetical protein [Clostridiales bacterium]